MSKNELAALSSFPVSAALVALREQQPETMYLERIQLCGSCKYVKKGKIGPGRYGVPQAEGEILDLGESIDVVPFAVIDKALDTKADPTPLSVFDPNDPVFIDIKERSKTKNSGCMWGVAILLFERNTGKFYEWFCGNKSSRISANHVALYLPVSESQAKEFKLEAQNPQPMTLSAKFVEGEFSYHVPVVSKCSTPFTNLPDTAAAVKESTKFLNPKTNDTELAEGSRSR